MKCLIITSIAALLLVAAVAAPAAAGDQQTFRGSWTSADAFDFSAPGCPAGTLLRYRTEGRTTFTHLGLTTVSMTHCTYMSGPAPSGGWRDGEITLTAANGDELYLQDDGRFDLTVNEAGPNPPFSAAAGTSTWIVTGGTGRFDGATGSGTGWANDDMLTGIQQFGLTGSIRY